MSELSIFPVLSRFFKFIQVSHERDRLWVSLRRGGLFLGFVFVESVKAVTPGSCRIDVPSSAQSLSMGSSCGEGRAHLLPAGHEICSVDGHYCLRWSDTFHSCFMAVYAFFLSFSHSCGELGQFCG